MPEKKQKKTATVPVPEDGCGGEAELVENALGEEQPHHAPNISGKLPLLSSIKLKVRNNFDGLSFEVKLILLFPSGPSLC
jgi:hypothetical protein